MMAVEAPPSPADAVDVPTLAASSPAPTASEERSGLSLMRPLEGLVRTVVGGTPQTANPSSPAAHSTVTAGLAPEGDEFACAPTLCTAASLSSVLSRLSDPPATQPQAQQGGVDARSTAACERNADSVSMAMSGSLVMCSDGVSLDARNSDMQSLASAPFRVDDSGSEMGDAGSVGGGNLRHAMRPDAWSLARFYESLSVLDGDSIAFDAQSVVTLQSHRSATGSAAGGAAETYVLADDRLPDERSRRFSAPASAGRSPVPAPAAEIGMGVALGIPVVGAGASAEHADGDSDGDDDGLCPICLDEVPRGLGSFVMPGCECAFCEPCIAQFYILRIEEGEIQVMPCARCGIPAPEDALQRLVGEYGAAALSRYKELKRRSAVDRDPDRTWCPEPNCNTAVHRSAAVTLGEIRRRALLAESAASVAGDASGTDAKMREAKRRHSWPRFGSSRKGKGRKESDVETGSMAETETTVHYFVDCPTCRRAFCFDCHGEWHDGQTCDEYVAARAKEKRDKAGERKFRKWAHKKTRKCPECNVKIEKMGDGSCNHMICSVCRTEFCWLCGQRIPPEGHFDRNNIRGCPGLQYGVESVSQLGLAKARARVAGRYAGKAALVALAVPWVIVAAVPVAAYVGVRVAHRRWSMRRR